MRNECQYASVCDVYEPLMKSCPRSGCGLEWFLIMITKEKSNFSDQQQDLDLIKDLEDKYVKTWNDNVNSRAKGAATGKTFEKWITDFLVRNGKKVEKGKVNFKFGAFQVDVAIPSRKAPQVLFEIKINSDRQHALMFPGLFHQMMKQNVKIGYISLYEPPNEVLNILNEWKVKYHPTFDFFHIENGWSKSLNNIIAFSKPCM